MRFPRTGFKFGGRNGGIRPPEAFSATPGQPGSAGTGGETCHRRNTRKAFSLVELIVVMVIIGMLAGLVVVRTRSYLIASKLNIAKAEIANIVKALETFYADQGRYPSNDEGLVILTEGTSTFPDGFLPRIPKDPWKQAYEYVSPGRESAFEVICLGADGKEGGEGADRDISSEHLTDETE